MFSLIIEIIILLGIITVIGIQIHFFIEVILKRKNYNIITPPKDTKADKLDELVNILKEDREDKIRKEKEKELVEYARKRRMEIPSGEIRSSIGSALEEELVKFNTNGDLVPYNLSPRDKEILKQFYNS